MSAARALPESCSASSAHATSTPATSRTLVGAHRAAGCGLPQGFCNEQSRGVLGGVQSGGAVALSAEPLCAEEPPCSPKCGDDGRLLLGRGASPCRLRRIETHELQSFLRLARGGPATSTFSLLSSEVSTCGDEGQRGATRRSGGAPGRNGGAGSSLFACQPRFSSLSGAANGCGGQEGADEVDPSGALTERDAAGVPPYMHIDPFPVASEERFPEGESPAAKTVCGGGNQATPFSLPKEVIVAIYMVYAFLTGCVYFGWPSLAYMLFQSGAYSWLCEVDENGNYVNDLRGSAGAEGDDETKYYICDNQDAAVSPLFTICYVTQTLMSIVSGTLLDHVSPKKTAMLGQLLNAAGWLLLALSSKEFPAYAAGMVFIGLGTDTGYLPTLLVATLFPGKRATVITLLGTANTSSFAVPLILAKLWGNVLPSWTFSQICVLYLFAGPICCFLLAALFIPWVAYGKAPAAAKPVLPPPSAVTPNGHDSKRPKYRVQPGKSTSMCSFLDEARQAGSEIDAEAGVWRQEGGTGGVASSSLQVDREDAEAESLGHRLPRPFRFRSRKRRTQEEGCSRERARVVADEAAAAEEAVGDLAATRGDLGEAGGMRQGRREEESECATCEDAVSAARSAESDKEGGPESDACSLGCLRAQETSRKTARPSCDFHLSSQTCCAERVRSHHDDSADRDEVPSITRSCWPCTFCRRRNREAQPFRFERDGAPCLDHDREGNGEELSFLSQLCSSHFLCIALYWSCQAVATSFLQTAASRLFPTRIVDFMDFALSFSFIPCVLLGKTIDVLGPFPVLIFINTAGAVAYFFSIFGMLFAHGGASTLQYIAVICFCMYVSIDSEQVFCYVENTFSSRHFGKLSGLALTVGGVISLGSIPLYETVTIRMLKGNPLPAAWSIAAVLAVVYVMLGCMWFVRRRNPRPFHPRDQAECEALPTAVDADCVKGTPPPRSFLALCGQKLANKWSSRAGVSKGDAVQTSRCGRDLEEGSAAEQAN
ncbi:transporter, major facilitator family protein [Besnoitia besnoiti]|uniref:Transporter, major facilitator family protein n=1 Tax=Besnoitia besnoiti TaxID=94643 RepID=A0A2A9MID4_BESBE|nr:transporter, major facilitator family protein [Besnoitia besnoiti]PFH37745.1 transporter, major facilitator family protein [Besnoitia besnoiti]